MIPYRESMEQRATYWPPAGNDGFGGNKLGAPVPVCCRWQDKAVLFRTPEGREDTSQSVVYVGQCVATGGRLLLGVSDARVPPAGAREIRGLDVSPDLEAAEALHKAYL